MKTKLLASAPTLYDLGEQVNQFFYGQGGYYVRDNGDNTFEIRHFSRPLPPGFHERYTVRKTRERYQFRIATTQ